MPFLRVPQNFVSASLRVRDGAVKAGKNRPPSVAEYEAEDAGYYSLTERHVLSGDVCNVRVFVLWESIFIDQATLKGTRPNSPSQDFTRRCQAGYDP